MDDLSLLLTTLRAAGALALSFHGNSPKKWNKPDGTIVTEADIAVDDLLKSTITKARPADGWFSEETRTRLIDWTNRDCGSLTRLTARGPFLRLGHFGAPAWRSSKTAARSWGPFSARLKM